MNWKELLIGIAFLALAYFAYEGIKREKPSSEETNWQGPALTTYIQYWGGIILCLIVGIAFILKSFSSQI